MTETPTVAPIALGTVYNSFNDFKRSLTSWENKFGHHMRIGASEILNNYHGVRDEDFKYRLVVLHCVHFGQPNDRGSVRTQPCRHASGCGAMLRLNFSWDDQLLRITFLVEKHTGHPRKTEADEPDEGSRTPFSDDLVPLKKARQCCPDLTDEAIRASCGRRASSTKPRVSYPLMAALAIFNSPKRCLVNKEICIFIETHFTCCRNSDGTWKNAVRNTLHNHNYFAKQSVQIKDRDIMAFSIKEMDKFMEELTALQNKYSSYDRNAFGLTSPELWGPMTRGELRHSQTGMDYPNISHKMTEDEEVAMFCDPSSSNRAHQFITSVGVDRSTMTPDSGRGSAASPMDHMDHLVPLNMVPQFTYTNIVKPIPMRPTQQPSEVAVMDTLMAPPEFVGKEYTDISQL